MKDKFIKHIVLPHVLVFGLGIIICLFDESDSSILDFLAIVKGILCITLLTNLIHFIVYVYKKNLVNNEKEEKPKSRVLDKDLFEIKEKPKRKRKILFIKQKMIDYMKRLLSILERVIQEELTSMI